MTDLRTWVEQVRADYGELTPRLMVEAARVDGPEVCPVYNRLRFDDDAGAAEMWRINEARLMLTKLRIVYRESDGRRPERSVRAFHAVPMDGQKAHRYEPADLVATDPVMRELVLRDMERDWKQMKARYGHLQEFIALVTADLGVAAEAA